MRFRCTIFAALATLAVAMPAGAQTITEDVYNAFVKGLAAEKPQLSQVSAQLSDIDKKIADFKSCADLLRETLSGLKLKIALKAKCGATSEDGFYKDRQKLLDAPEAAGAAAAGMKRDLYAQLKEKVGAYLGGNRNFADGELKVLNAHASALSDAMGMALSKASADGGGSRLGNAIASRMGIGAGAFTADMTWAYVGYLWGIMYMSGATMFETAYQPGQWTQWQISDASQPDNKVLLERALLSRQADGSEWWRIKTINTTPQQTDTIILESLFKKMDEGGQMMQVVRMRGKLPGDTEGKELMVPQNLGMISTQGLFPFKPTAESVEGATVGTDNVKVGSSSFAAKHVKFGAGGGSMEWWLADKAPGSVVRVQFSGQSAEQKWTMEMVGTGSGAKSELGVK